MTLRNSPFREGKLSGVTYDFEDVGDTLAMHEHQPEATHLTFVVRGSITVRGDGFEPVTKGKGAMFDPTPKHEFEALEPNTRVVNIFK